MSAFEETACVAGFAGRGEPSDYLSSLAANTAGVRNQGMRGLSRLLSSTRAAISTRAFLAQERHLVNRFIAHAARSSFRLWRFAPVFPERWGATLRHPPSPSPMAPTASQLHAPLSAFDGSISNHRLMGCSVSAASGNRVGQDKRYECCIERKIYDKNRQSDARRDRCTHQKRV